MDLDKKIGIRENLIAEVGEQEAEMIWDRAKMILKEIEARYPDLPKGQQMHAGYIFPSAAVQLAVREIKGDQDLGYKVISEYSWAKSREMGARLRKSAKIPGFKSLFVKMWGPISKKMFGPDAGFGNVFYPKEKAAYRMDIIKCPYNSYFTELGTPELTKIFCINDECTYGDIPGLEFIRHTTLGTGGNRCDFYVRVTADELEKLEKAADQTGVKILGADMFRFAVKKGDRETRYKDLTIREFTKAADVYESGHAGIYEMCKDDYPFIAGELAKEGYGYAGCDPQEQEDAVITPSFDPIDTYLTGETPLRRHRASSVCR